MRFDAYIQSNETPQDLCREIDELQKKYEELNDFSNSQVKKLLKKNEKLKKDKEDISRDFMSVYETNIALNIKLKELLKND